VAAAGRVNRNRCYAMTAFDLFSIGHSNIPADRFIALLRDAGADAVADVRSTPYSRFFPWFSHRNLEARLVTEGMAYLPYGKTLGGRPQDQSLYRDGIADYEAMARQNDFRAGLAQLQTDASRLRVCLMCAEREPHGSTEQRLMAWSGAATESDLFVTGQSERLAAAYCRRARAVAYRAKQGSGGGEGKRRG
jgi:hypothetical protein